MYEAAPDPYCHPGSAVLRNKAGLTSAADLERFETAMTFARAEEPLPRGRYSETHCHLFQDVYGWAGRYRTVRMSKGKSSFCYPEHIGGEMKRAFSWLKDRACLRGLDQREFVEGAAHFLAELNAIHPFREGNGRTQLSFMALVADNAKHPLNLDKLDPKSTLKAMIRSFAGDERPLQALLTALIT